MYSSLTHHDYQNADKYSNKISEKGQGMLYIVQVTQVCLLNYVLCVHNHVAHKHQKPKVYLGKQR